MEENNDFYALTFSQREGKASLPEIMQLGKIPQRFRQMIWLYIDQHINNITHISGDFYEMNIDKDISQVFWEFKFDILKIPHDKIEQHKPHGDKKFARQILLHGSYDEVFTFLEYILRHRECSVHLSTEIRALFDSHSLAYHVVNFGDFPTIIIRTNRETGETTQKAIEEIRDGCMDGATTHLRQAAEHINSGRYADAITHSIHAVESVARFIDPKSSGTLGPALQSLEQANVLKHPALKQAFLNLYGYTSDEQGLRHALLDQDAANVGLDEAVFMFGACAAFAAYLTQKHRQASGTCRRSKTGLS